MSNHNDFDKFDAITLLPNEQVIASLLDRINNLIHGKILDIVSHIADVRDDLIEQIKLEVQISLLRGDWNKKKCQIEAERICDAFLATLPKLITLLDEDISNIHRIDPSAKSVELIILCYPGFAALRTYRIAHELHALGLSIIPQIMAKIAHSKTRIDIHPGATIGHRFFIESGTGVVIGETAKIGDDVIINQGVTIGARKHLRDEHGFVRHSGDKRHPTIGNRVIIYANATILGGDTIIGDNAIIGASTWITSSIPPSMIVTADEPKTSNNNIKFQNIYKIDSDLYYTNFNIHDINASVSPICVPLVPPKPPEKQLSWKERFNTVLGTLPDGFEALVSELGKATHGSRQAIAKRLEPALNAHLQAMPQETLEQKKAICAFLEKTLEPLGLAVACPNTEGLPGKLKASTGSWPGVGRFNFEVYIEGKQKKPAYSDTLPVLTLIDSVSTVEPETPWQDKVGTKASRRGHNLS